MKDIIILLIYLFIGYCSWKWLFLEEPLIENPNGCYIDGEGRDRLVNEAKSI